MWREEEVEVSVGQRCRIVQIEDLQRAQTSRERGVGRKLMEVDPETSENEVFGELIRGTEIISG